MLRIIRDFVPKPRYFILCDLPTCSCYAQCDIPDVPMAVAATHDPIVGFLNAIEKEGWGVTLLQHRCPDHNKLAKAAIEQQRRLIIPANGPLPASRH